MKKKILFILLLILSVIVSSTSINIAFANELNDNINEQVENLDLTELEDFYNKVVNDELSNLSLKDKLFSLLKGEYSTDYNSIFEILLYNAKLNIKRYLPIILSIIAIAIFSTLATNVKSKYLSQSTISVVNLVCSLSISLILYKELFSAFTITENTINNIAKLNEIMSPIIVTLMVAIGGNASASVYTPQTLILSGIITNIIIKIIIPLVIMMTIISIVGDLSDTNKLNSFSEFITSLIKWVLGVSFTVFTIFITTQGLTASTFDSASIRATKYAISNSIPIVGGFLKDGFDVMIAGSILIKNALGIVSIITMLSLVFSPVIKMATFSLLIKLATAIIDVFSTQKITTQLKNTSKCISYFNVSILVCGFMFFLTILLSIMSANAFI